MAFDQSFDRWFNLKRPSEGAQDGTTGAQDAVDSEAHKSKKFRAASKVPTV